MEDDTIFKKDHQTTITEKIGLIWFSSFRDDLNVIFIKICPICIIGTNRLKENFYRINRNI